MSKVFIHAQVPGSPRVLVERGADGSNVYHVASKPGSIQVATSFIGLIAIGGGAALVLYFWWHWVLAIAIAFLLAAKWAARHPRYF
jgi:hypothetical protein